MSASTDSLLYLKGQKVEAYTLLGKAIKQKMKMEQCVISMSQTIADVESEIMKIEYAIWRNDGGKL